MFKRKYHVYFAVTREGHESIGFRCIARFRSLFPLEEMPPRCIPLFKEHTVRELEVPEGANVVILKMERAK